MNEPELLIRFRCKNCGQKIRIPKIHAGKKGKCPKCRNIVIVPQTGDTTPLASQTKPDGMETGSKDNLLDPLLFDIPKKSESADQPTAQKDISDETLEDLQKLEEKSGIDKTEQISKRKLPWFIDVFLYPLNLAGAIHLICLWLLVFLLCPLAMGLLGLGIEYIPIVYTLPIAYVLYYFTECIRDSTVGRFRAPDFWMRPNEDKWDCISQLFIVLGCIAACFCPASVYYIVAERTDLMFWLLLACGSFFFPMVLLAAVLFDSFNALNPILIIGSIFHTFLPYCGMVLLFYGGALLFMKIDPPLYRLRLLPAAPFIFRALQLYLMFVAVGLLGRFYWRYQEKLNWEV